MNPKDAADETSLGAILIEMGAINRDQLQIALEKQANSTLEERLGMVLVHIGYCTNEEIELALSAQSSMRSAKDPGMQRALVAIDMAIHRKTSNGARQSAIQKGAQVRHQSGTGYEAITPGMLAKRSNEG